MPIRRTIALSCVALLGCVTPPAGALAGRTANPSPAASGASPGAADASAFADASASDASWDAADALPSPVATGPLGPFLPAPDAERYLPLVTDLILQTKGRPTDTKSRVVFAAGGPRKLVLGEDGGDLTVIPVQLSFDSYDNRFCRLAVLRSGTPAPGIVPLPTGYDDPTCASMRKLTEADLNHDGMPDLVFELRVKSNRGPGIVSNAAVYLSDRSRMTYCFADRASEAVMVVGAYTAARAVAAVASEVRRRGQEILACAKDLPEDRRDGGPGTP